MLLLSSTLTRVPGYKVGRVEQAETALGAEMRMAAEKGTGKAKAKGNAGQDKIVRRSDCFVHIYQGQVKLKHSSILEN